MLEVNSISFSYDIQPTVRQLSFQLERGKHLAIIGESGSGKSTLLKLIYGLYDLESGTIHYNEQQILGPKFNLIPGDDRFKYLAQDFGLMPYITAGENVGKYLSNIDGKKKQDRIAELLELVEMSDYATTKVQYLSGGQQQRIALAKALALESELFLLDEPFSQIDAFRAGKLKRNLFGYFKKNGISCIVATHEGQDVLSFADEVLVMKDGQMIEMARPKQLYALPSSYYVASLFGEINQIPRRLLQNGNPDELLLAYPHQLKIAASGIKAIVGKSYFRGNHYLIEARYDSGLLFFENREPILEGQGVFLALNP